METPQHKNPMPGVTKFTTPAELYTQFVTKTMTARLLTPQTLHNKLGLDWPSSSWDEDIIA